MLNFLCDGQGAVRQAILMRAGAVVLPVTSYYFSGVGGSIGSVSFVSSSLDKLFFMTIL